MQSEWRDNGNNLKQLGEAQVSIQLLSLPEETKREKTKNNFP